MYITENSPEVQAHNAVYQMVEIDGQNLKLNVANVLTAPPPYVRAASNS